jgi:hypothetical protein
VKGGNGPAAAAGGMTAPLIGGGADAETGAAVGDGPAAGRTGGGPDAAPAVEASCEGGGDETGGGSNGAPPLLPPSPAFRPREKSLGTAEVGGEVRPLAGLARPEPSDPADGVLVDIPDDGIPVDGKFSPPGEPPVMGKAGLVGDVVGAPGCIGGSPEEPCCSASDTGRLTPGFLAFGSTGGRWPCRGLELGAGAGALPPGS